VKNNIIWIEEIMKTKMGYAL